MADQPTEGPRADPPARVGLCCNCRFARVQRSERGSEFWRCQRADGDEAFLRYPPLPVTACEGFAWDLQNAEERVYTETHASARDFLNSLHDLGVTGGSGPLLTRSELLTLESVYESRFRRPGGVCASYHIGFLDLVKRST